MQLARGGSVTRGRYNRPGGRGEGERGGGVIRRIDAYQGKIHHGVRGRVHWMRVFIEEGYFGINGDSPLSNMCIVRYFSLWSILHLFHYLYTVWNLLETWHEHPLFS